MGSTMTDQQWSQCQHALAAHARREANAQRTAHIKRGRSPRTFRYCPPQWHRDAVKALGRGDYEAVFACIMYPQP